MNYAVNVETWIVWDLFIIVLQFHMFRVHSEIRISQKLPQSLHCSQFDTSWSTRSLHNPYVNLEDRVLVESWYTVYQLLISFAWVHSDWSIFFVLGVSTFSLHWLSVANCGHFKVMEMQSWLVVYAVMA